MVFNSFQYALFFPTVLLTYWRLPHRGQTALLVFASYLFYAAWDWRFLGLMMLTTVVDYTVGRALAATEDRRRRKLLFGASVALNLGVLGFFKYFDFFVDSAVDLLEHTPLNPGRPALNVLLPVGISFYTFHGISYTFDVFRNDIRPTRNLLTFAAFVSYFPQLVAGPIGRAEVQLPQFEQPRRAPSTPDVESALFLILLGLFKKIVIADALAPYVDEVFGAPAAASAATLALGAWAFALQIYGDFSGYTDIARGSSRLLGIELLNNFSQPYLSRDITEFWRTWHISLSSWLRDYLYIPLGGNRGGLRRTQRNLLITMFLGGLWHGAAWTFVAWGTLHGLLLAFERMLPRRTERASLPALAEAVTDRTGARRAAGEGVAEPVGWKDALPIAATFNVVCFSWILFRAESFDGAWTYLRGLFTLQPGGPDLELLALFLPLAGATLAIDIVQRNTRDEAALMRLPAPAYGALVGAAIASLIVFSGTAGAPFIYFQF